MTKRPQKPGRTHPLDRDGDGQIGGSLPGNQTAPMATSELDAARALLGRAFIYAATPEQSPAAAVAKTLEAAKTRWGDAPVETRELQGNLVVAIRMLPEDGAAPTTELIEAAEDMVDNHAVDDGSLPGNQTAPMAGPETVAQTALASTTTGEGRVPWARVDAEILEDLDLAVLALTARESGATVETVAAWSDEDAKAAQDWLTKTVFDTNSVDADRARPAILASFFEPPAPTEDQLLAHKDEATFSPEEIATGQTPVAQEDEAEALAAELGVVIDPADPIITVRTPSAPVAVKVRELQRLVDNRWLYKTEHGFSPNTHPPYVEAETAQVWVAAGLAQWEPSAGNHGGIRVTAEARSLLVRKGQVAA